MFWWSEFHQCMRINPVDSPFHHVFQEKAGACQNRRAQCPFRATTCQLRQRGWLVADKDVFSPNGHVHRALGCTSALHRSLQAGTHMQLYLLTLG